MKYTQYQKLTKEQKEEYNYKFNNINHTISFFTIYIATIIIICFNILKPDKYYDILWLGLILILILSIIITQIKKYNFNKKINGANK